MNIGDRKEITIGSNVFHVAKFEPFKAMKNLGNIQKIVFPVIGEAMAGAKGIDGVLDKDLSSNADINSLMPMLQGIFTGMADNIDGDNMEKLFKILLDPEYISVEDPNTGKPSHLNQSMINTIFMSEDSDLSDMMLLAFEVLKLNYASFFTKLSTRFGNLGAFMN